MKNSLLEKKWKYAYKFNTYLQNFYNIVEDKQKENKQIEEISTNSNNSNISNNLEII